MLSSTSYLHSLQEIPHSRPNHSYIRDGHLFGFVECDIEVPDHLKECFSEMTAKLKNVDVCLDDVGEFMQNYAKEHSIKDVPRRLLIGSYFGKKIGLTTPLLNWYLEHGSDLSLHVFTLLSNVYLMQPSVVS